MTEKIHVPQKWVDRAHEFAQKLIKDGERSQASIDVSYEPGSAQDFDVQYSGRLCEIAAALYFEADPGTALRWETNRGGDGGVDIVHNGIAIDVKGSANSRAENLIYSVTALKHFESSKCDVLMFVRGNTTDEFEIVGWCSKARFRRDHGVAAEGDKRFCVGTWYLDSATLTPCDKLKALTREQFDAALARARSKEEAAPAPAPAPVQYERVELPSLQDMLAEHGGYMAIPQAAWDRYYARLASIRSGGAH